MKTADRRFAKKSIQLIDFYQQLLPGDVFGDELYAIGVIDIPYQVALGRLGKKRAQIVNDALIFNYNEVFIYILWLVYVPYPVVIDIQFPLMQYAHQPLIIVFEPGKAQRLFIGVVVHHYRPQAGVFEAVSKKIAVVIVYGHLKPKFKLVEHYKPVYSIIPINYISIRPLCRSLGSAPNIVVNRLSLCRSTHPNSILLFGLTEGAGNRKKE